MLGNQSGLKHDMAFHFGGLASFNFWFFRGLSHNVMNSRKWNEPGRNSEDTSISPYSSMK